MFKFLNSFLVLSLFMLSCSSFTDKKESKINMSENKNTNSVSSGKGLSVATFGAGCFWCVEAQFQLLEGVDTVISGYTGGTVAHPTYQQVCTGTTGHAEVCNIYYDSTKISYTELIQAFFICHDPTQLNQQGNDHGTQYRSVVYYRTEQEKEIVKKIIAELDASGSWSKPIVTEISPMGAFYEAEDYHQNYYNLNNNQPYCTFVVKPKKEHFEKVFKDKLKYKN